MRNSLSYIALLLAVAMVLLILLSWIWAAVMPEANVRSLLSSEGIRWFFGHFVDNMATPLLVWLVLITIAHGTVSQCGIVSSLMLKHQRNYRERFALRVVIVETLIFVAVMILLTALPQAILLSVTGNLFPSSFSASIVPVICFILVADGITFGVLSGVYTTLDEVFRGMTHSFRHSGSVFLLYILVAQLYYSVRFVFQV